MKKRILTLFTLLSISTFASLKPDWSIVATSCGDNTLFFTTARDPSVACKASVTGHQHLEVIFFSYDNNSKKFYLVTKREMNLGDNTITLEELVVNEGRYDILVGLKKNGEILEITEEFGYSGKILKGNDFEGGLYPVFTTL